MERAAHRKKTATDRAGAARRLLIEADDRGDAPRGVTRVLQLESLQVE